MLTDPSSKNRPNQAKALDFPTKICYTEPNLKSAPKENMAMKNSRKLTTLLLATLLLTDVVACTDKDDGASTTEGDDTQATVTESSSPDETQAPVEITVSEDTAHAVSPTGLTYAAAGYTAVQNNRLTFTNGLTLTFDPADTAESFNRFTMGYVSTQPLYGIVTYEVDGTAVTDDFYLEAGTNTFSCLISRYLDSKMGAHISSIQLETCNGQPADFALCALQTNDHPIYSVDRKQVYYLENDRFKLGIRLNWGGGITYLEDKQDGHMRLKNLINEYDPGRMIQQSYYSDPQTDEYTPGYYGETLWCYNPVQGGDVKGGTSRIIDVVVTDASVYIKSQPCDWSAGVAISPAYMENTYTLYSDRVQVDNRFVDFSGWEHNVRSQELPAFYTVSYLGTFSFYNGTKPWTGDTLSYRDDLDFWGGPNRDTFAIKESNTETWCAWTNTEDDFGIGLFVPNIDTHLAGRFLYDGTPVSRLNPCNYVAPLKHLKLTSFEALEYSYLVTTGSLQGIRDAFTQHKDFADNADLSRNSVSGRCTDRTTAYNEYKYGMPIPQADPLSEKLDLTKEFNAMHLSANGSTEIYYDAEQGAIALCTLGGDPYFTVPYAETISADTHKTLKIEYMIPTANSADSYKFGLFLSAGDYHYATPEAYYSVNVTADGQYHTLEADLSDCTFWTGDIHQIRFDFFEGSAVGDIIYIKSISLE